ncbi:Pre-mRNA-splicing factor cef1, partial [Tulasnella sp. 417]
AKAYAAPIGHTLRRLDNKRKPEEEAAEAKKRAKKAQEGKEGPHQTKFLAAREAQIQKLKEAEQIGKRRKLVLPTAQVGEAELEEIVKIGQAGENARASLRDGTGEGSEASANLFSEYEGLDHARTARTPRTAPQEDNVLAEALALRNMNNLQTPLLGDENTPLHPTNGTGFEGATPRHQVAFTPNPLATPLHHREDGSATPRGPAGVGATPLRTPMRDGLSLNASDGASRIGDTPREIKMHANAAKRSLQAGFASLPKPKNDFELDVESLEPTVEDEEESAPMTEEDAAERDARIKRRKEEEERKALARRSVVVQRGLPRPINIDEDTLLASLSAVPESDPSLAEARKLVNSELVALVQHDTIAHPLPGTRYPGSTESAYVHPDDASLALAKAMVHGEVATALGFPAANEEQIKRGIILFANEEEVDPDLEDWAATRSKLAYDASSGTWVDPQSLSEAERIAGLTALLDQQKEQMTTEASKAAKSEKKLGKLLGGYQARWGTLSKRLTDTFEELNKTQIELESFQQLSITETIAIPQRVQGLSEEVDRLEKRERTLQERYRDLDYERREVQARIAEKEDRIMAEAEAMAAAMEAAET